MHTVGQLTHILLWEYLLGIQGKHYPSFNYPSRQDKQAVCEHVEQLINLLEQAVQVMLSRVSVFAEHWLMHTLFNK